MRKTSLIVLIVVLFSFAGDVSGQSKEIIGYYPSWKWRGGPGTMTQEKIPYRKLTMINYAFFFPLPDGTVVGRDSVGDARILRGAREPGEAGPTRRPTLTELAHQNGVKVLVSIGGWGESDNFPQAASDGTRRARFAHSCITHIKDFGFDGIDIDWEFPGYVEHKGTPADKENFTLLLQTIRDSLTALGNLRNRHYLLTAALSARAIEAAETEVEKIAGILDFLNIMTYDFYGSWDPHANHNAPLYASAGSDSARSVDGAFDLYHKKYRVPADRITIGIPFYGHAYMNCTALTAGHGGEDTVHFKGGGAFYSRIVDKMSNFSRRWDERAKVPYLISNSWNMLVSYDDEESVRYKAEYAVDRGTKGVIIWEITGDYLADGKTPLLDVVNATFHTSK